MGVHISFFTVHCQEDNEINSMYADYRMCLYEFDAKCKVTRSMTYCYTACNAVAQTSSSKSRSMCKLACSLIIIMRSETL